MREFTRNKNLLKADDKYGVNDSLLELNTNWDIIDDEFGRIDSDLADIAVTNANVEVSNTHRGANGQTYTDLPSRLDSIDTITAQRLAMSSYKKQGAEPDDTARIQRALNALSNNSILELEPKKTYNISSLISLSNTNNIQIIGNGAKFICASEYGDVLKFTACNNIFVSGLEIQGGETNPGSRAYNQPGTSLVNFTSCNHVRLEKCNLHNGNCNGVSAIDSTGITFYDNDISQVNCHMIWTNRCDTVHVDYNRLTGIGNIGGTMPVGDSAHVFYGGIGYLGTRGNNIFITHNTIKNISDTGSKTEGATNVVYDSNHVENVGKDGIKIQGYQDTLGTKYATSNGKIINNTVMYINYWRTDGTTHIMVDDCDGAIVDNNYTLGGIKTQGEENGLKTYNQYGATNNKNVIISNNHFAGTYLTHGMYILYSDNVVVSGNICEQDINCANGVGTYKFSGNSVGNLNNVAFTVIGGSKIQATDNDFNGQLVIQPLVETKNITVKANNIDYNGTSDPVNITNYSSGVASVNTVSIVNNTITLLNTTVVSNILRITCTKASYGAVQIADNFVNLNGQSKSLLLVNTDSSGGGAKIQLVFVGNNYPLISTYNLTDVVTYKGWIYMSTAPTQGTWSKGDRVINSNPTVGQPKAWTCTTAGTPGTWTSEGVL